MRTEPLQDADVSDGSIDLELQETEYRAPLPLEEIPLPPGYPRSILDPARKALEREAHWLKVEENVRQRRKIVGRAASDQGFRQKVMELCKRDVEFFIDYFVWTYDDRIGSEEPLVLYDFQREKLVHPYLRMIESKQRERVTMCVEKSRGVGYTWVELAMRVWRWLFADNWSILVGAVIEDDVDDGGQEASHESLFGKMRFILEKLPEWFREETIGPLWKQDRYNKRLRLTHPYKRLNIIVGKHFGTMFGRGKRYSEVFGDEIAYADQFKNADTSLKQTTNRFSGGSTPQGMHSFHAQLMKGPLKVVRRTMHWSEHPELDMDWYNDQRQHMTDDQIAQELDINYEGSAGRRVLPEVRLTTHFIEVRTQNVLTPSGMRWDGTLYTPDLPLHAMIDPGISDPMAVVWLQPDPYHNEWRVVDFVQTLDRTIDWIVPFILGSIPEVTYEGNPWRHTYNKIELNIIQRHARWDPVAETFGDAYGSARSMVTDMSAYDLLSRYGIDVCPIKVTDDTQAISYLQVWMRHVRVSAHLQHQRNGPPDTHPTFAEVLTNWRYKPNPEGEGAGKKPKPVHDVYCHAGDCLKMYAQTVDLPDPSQLPLAAGKVYQRRPKSVSVPRPYRARR